MSSKILIQVVLIILNNNNNINKQRMFTVNVTKKQTSKQKQTNVFTIVKYTFMQSL